MHDKHIVIGLGEVGSALQKVIGCDGEDRFKGTFHEKQHFDFLHICIPYSENFVDEVLAYQDKYSPKYTIIHSSVPIGTSRKCKALHSPIRGVHPNLDMGILTFKKFIGGEKSYDVAQELNKFGIDCICTLKPENTEALKLLDTLQYGILIMLEKEIYKFCKEHSLDENIVYTLANETYNEGYLKMFRPEVVRPYLKHMDGKIGGHCVINNAKITDFWLARMLLNKNEEY